MGIISRFGCWLDTRFPEKISADEVRKSLDEYKELRRELYSLEDRFVKLENLPKDILELKDELNKAKAVIALTSKIRQNPVMPSSKAWER